MQNLIRCRHVADANLEKQKNLLECEQKSTIVNLHVNFSTYSFIVTSDGSATRAHIQLVQKQLLEADVKRVTNEKNHRRKEHKRKRELELKTELEV